MDSGFAQAPPPPPQAPPPTVEELVVGTNTSAAELESVVDGLMLIAGAAVPYSPVSVTETGEEERLVYVG